MANIQPIGFILLYREIAEHWIYPNHRKLTPFEAWIDLLMMANYAERKTVLNGQVVVVNSGEILCSQQGLALRWMWGHKEARNFLKLLKKDGMILIKPKNKWTVLTICNWDNYQVLGQSKDKQRKTIGQTADKQRTTLEQGKQSKEDKEDGEHTFELSPFFNPVKFAEQLPDWPKEQLRYYYDSLLDYSKQGNKYKDWIAAARTWARKDKEAARGFFSVKKPVVSGFMDGGIVQ